MTTLRLNQILVDPDHNPRKGDLDGIKELAASIHANGLLQPILVRLLPHPPETYEIVAGHRRFAAVQELGWEEINCQITRAENRLELALTENVMRQAMHPVDEYAAFAKLLAEGLKPKAIAKRFGLTEKGVKQRLALGSMIPEVRHWWREDRITDAAAKRLATASPEQQQEILARFTDRGGIDEYMVNSHLRQDRVSPEDKRLKFVGLATYKEAGGKIESDLFGDEKWLSDPGLLDQLTENRINEVTDGIMQEGYRVAFFAGDDDVPGHDTHDRLYNDGTFEPEERRLIDVVVSIGYDGDPVLTFWKDKAERPADQPKEKAGASFMAEPDLSKSLSMDMSRVMTGFAHAYGQQPSNHHTVLAMLAYTLTHPVQEGPMRVKPCVLTPSPVERQILAASWPDFSENDLTFEGLLDTDESDLVHLIVQAAAKTFDFADGAQGAPKLRKQWYLQLQANSEAHPAWKPTAENYFKRLNAKQIRAAMRQMRPGEWTDQFADAKKGELVTVAERWAAETGWLPELLAPRLYDDAENPPGGGDVNPSIEGETEVKQHLRKILHLPQAAE